MDNRQLDLVYLSKAFANFVENPSAANHKAMEHWMTQYRTSCYDKRLEDIAKVQWDSDKEA